MTHNPLVFIPSVRDLPEIKEAVDKLPYSTLWVKYMNQDQAYTIGRNLFLNLGKHDYTHLIIVPDDLIVTEDQIEQLFDDSEYHVISGWCVHGKTKDPRVGLDTNLSYHLFTGEPSKGEYEDYKHITVEEVNRILNDPGPTDHPIKEVKFSGFAPTIIPRIIVDLIPFRTSEGCCVDSCFAQDLDKKGIPQFVDFRVKTIELKASDLDIYGHLGKKQPDIILNGSSI